MTWWPHNDPAFFTIINIHCSSPIFTNSSIHGFLVSPCRKSRHGTSYATSSSSTITWYSWSSRLPRHGQLQAWHQRLSAKFWHQKLPTLYCHETLPNLDFHQRLSTLHCHQRLPNLDFHQRLSTLHCHQRLPNLDCDERLAHLRLWLKTAYHRTSWKTIQLRLSSVTSTLAFTSNLLRNYF